MINENLMNSFPALKRSRAGKRPVYLDNACMTLRPIQVIRAMEEYYTQFPACASRSTHWFAGEVNERVEESYKQIAKFTGAKENELVFLKNATEALNLVANSIQKFTSETRKIVVITDKEHSSNTIPWYKLEAKGIIKLVILETKRDGTFDFEKFVDFMKNYGDKVILVSTVWVSNLDSVKFPIEEIIEIAKKYGALTMIDAAQALPHIPVNFENLGADFMAFSTHKMVGPAGGFLIVKEELMEQLEQLSTGGGTVEDFNTKRNIQFFKGRARLEAGLQDYAAIIGSAAAANFLKEVGLKNIEEHEKELTAYALELLGKIEDIGILGPKDPEKASGIVTFYIKKPAVSVEERDVGEAMSDKYNVMVRTGRFCVYNWFNAKGFPTFFTPIRASFYLYNTKEDVEVLAEAVKEAVDKVKWMPTVDVNGW